MTRKTYVGGEVDVSFDNEVCQHAALCVDGLPSVFDTKARPWINPDPTGLTITRHPPGNTRSPRADLARRRTGQYMSAGSATSRPQV